MLVFPSFYSLIIQNKPLESELEVFVIEQTKNYPLFSEKIYSFEIFKNKIEQSDIPSFLKKILLNNSSKYFDNGCSANEIITKKLYDLISIIIVGLVVFIAINILISIVLNLVLKNRFLSKEMFVTKRFVSGFFGGLKGFLVFFIVTGVLMFLAQKMSLSIVEEEIKNSPLFGVSGQFFSKYLISLGVW